MPAWLSDLRGAALRQFAQLDFPTRREELWRFTDLRPLQQRTFLPAADAEADSAALAVPRFSDAAHRIVLRNGRFVRSVSQIGALPEGVWLGSWFDAIRARPELAEAAFDASDTEGAQPFASLNASLAADGFVLAVEAGVSLDGPVEIVYIGGAEGAGHYLRNLVQLGAGSRAEIVEIFASDAAGWTNAVTRIDLGSGSSLRHIKIEDEAPGAIHFALNRAALAKEARLASFTLTLGARLSRQDTLVTLEGEGAELSLNGAYLVRGEQEATTATFVDHAAPGCTTRESFKGVLEDRAHGVFMGKIAVRPGADKTDAHQVNRNLLLSPRAAVDTKPELEILADDVKCSHGATVGDLDEAALFYLRSRGLTNDEARRLLIEAFAVDAIEGAVEPGPVREYLRRHLERWVERHGS